MNGADVQLPIVEQLREPQTLWARKGEIELAGDTPLEQREVLGPADAPDEHVQVMDLRRIDLHERTG